MRRFSDRHSMHTLTEINVTPLLDLAFVLLVIFIITTPLMENSVNLVVPSSSEATQAVNKSQVQTISIDKDDVMKLNEEVVDAAALESRLVALREEKPDVAVVVRPHKELPIQKFIDVMDILQRARISKVGVLTRPDQP
ncbi:MAG TPA: biopolymer transporter ExbD [Chthoniobacterales bacterium]|nr:biopolymer transporter ExbD [Chthoniobacterales bacterium]